MITYHGREMPCFMQRQTHLGGCSQRASYRVESDYLIMHMCETHTEKYRNDPEFSVTALAPIGELDKLGAVSLDPKELKESPWIVEAE